MLGSFATLVARIGICCTIDGRRAQGADCRLRAPYSRSVQPWRTIIAGQAREPPIQVGWPSRGGGVDRSIARCGANASHPDSNKSGSCAALPGWAQVAYWVGRPDSVRYFKGTLPPIRATQMPICAREEPIPVGRQRPAALAWLGPVIEPSPPSPCGPAVL